MKLLLLLGLTSFCYLTSLGQQTDDKTSIQANKIPPFKVQQTLADPTPGAESDCCKPKAGTNEFFPQSANARREITDLQMWGGVGEDPLTWKRYGNSREGTDILSFGNGHNWTHSFQFRMINTWAGSFGEPRIMIYFPEGNPTAFQRSNANPNLWLPLKGIGKRLFQYGNNFILQLENGYRYRFERVGINSYQLQDYLDSYKNLYTLTYDVNRRLTKITEPAGRFIHIIYASVNGTNVIDSVKSNDGRSVDYNYTVVGTGIYSVRLTSVTYGDGTQASYTYSQSQPTSKPNLEHAIDPRYNGAAVNMKYTYQGLGAIKEEKNGITGEVTASLDISSDNKKVCYPNGRVQIYNMPESQFGQMNSYTDGLGIKENFTYDNSGDGFRKTAIDALGRITTYNIRTMYGSLLEVTMPDGNKQKWTRDTLNRVITEIDELGRITTYTRDTRHRPTRIDFPDGSFETFTYNAFSQVLDHRKKNGGIEHFAYDGRGLKTSFTDALGNVTTYNYDVADRLSSVTDARGNTQAYQYNERGLLIKEINADLSFKIFGYDTYGNRTTVTNELGNTWTTIYDEFRRPVTVTDPLNRTTTYSYDLPGGACGCTHADNKPTKIISPGGKITRIEYDVEWRKIREVKGAGTADEASTYYEYDAVGNLAKTIDGRGKQWETTYDSRDRRKSTVDPLGNTTEWTYDLAGNILTAKRPDNGTTLYLYDNMNRVIQITDPKGQVTKMAYDTDGNMIKLTDSKNNDYEYQYDILDRKIKMIYPGGSQEVYTYDPVHNLKTYTNRNGDIRTYTYDNRNRQTLSDWSDATPDVSTNYDALSRITSMTSSVSALQYTYNNANEMLSESQNIAGSGGTKTVTYKYNADGLRDTLLYPGGTATTYTYTGRNQVFSISDGGASPVCSYAYDLNGNRLRKTLKNGTYTNYTYDDANRMLSVDNRKVGVSFARNDYAYDNMNRKKYVQYDYAKGDVYAYDAIDQITDLHYEVTDPGGVPGVPARTVNYGLDPSGNRTVVSDNGVPTNYTTNNLNQYTSVGAATVTNTINGNVQTFDGWTYTYDAQNRMTKAEKGASIVSFMYDGSNRCVMRIINGILYYYYFDDWNLLEERGAADNELVHYVHGAFGDEINLKNTTGNIVYFNHDGLNSVVSLTNTSGDVVEKYSYDIFGTPVIKSNAGIPLVSSAFGNHFLFTGREYLPDLNIYDYRNRMYLPETGKFFQTDPLSFDAGDINLYRYVLNNPTNLIDPFGLIWGCPPSDNVDDPSAWDYGSPGFFGNWLFNNDKIIDKGNITKKETKTIGECNCTVTYRHRWIIVKGNTVLRHIAIVGGSIKCTPENNCPCVTYYNCKNQDGPDYAIVPYIRAAINDAINVLGDLKGLQEPVKQILNGWANPPK